MSDSINSLVDKLQEVQVSLAKSFGALFFSTNRGQGHSRLPVSTERTYDSENKVYSFLPKENNNLNALPCSNIPAKIERSSRSCWV